MVSFTLFPFIPHRQHLILCRPISQSGLLIFLV
jgi:hypothetical protein